jgi:glycosyltransferase involved in cell wall biosynthesis
MNAKITTIAFSYNEETRIQYFLEALRNFSPIIVIDNFSTDNTVEIAKKYTNRVYRYKNAGYVEHPDVARFALSQVPTEWVYWGRVDEIPPLPLQQKLNGIVESDICDIVLISRLNLLFGLPSKSWGDDYQIILFKKSYMNVSEAALFEHGPIRKDARIAKLPATKELSLWHFSSYDINAYVVANNRYSTLASRKIVDLRNGSKSSYSCSTDLLKRTIKQVAGRIEAIPHLTALRLALVPGMRFFWHYFIRGGIKSGWVGLITSLLMMMEQMMTEMKIWELERGISLEKISGYYDELKAQLVSGKIPDIGKSFFSH